MREKIKLSQVVVVEGKYDAIKLDSIIDGLIIPVNGFYIYSDSEMKSLLRSLGRKSGIVLITDSDTAGFKIRNYIRSICRDSEIINVYIPQIKGKESRKSAPSKEGYLGVEGVEIDTILKALSEVGVTGSKSGEDREKLTYQSLYELGLSGTENSSRNRQILARALSIPDKLSKKSLLEVLNRMTDAEQIYRILNEKPALFWDFHGTLTQPDNQWVDAAIGLRKKYFPEADVPDSEIIKNLGGKCLPWWTYPERDTRHLMENDGWWKSCEAEFVKMYVASGLSTRQAEKLSPLIREYVVDYRNHRLYDDTLFVLSELKKRGYKSYMLSNNFPELPQMAEEMGLGEFFEGYIVSALIGYDKPRREIFERGREMAGLPARCIMIGDTPKDDMAGAKKAGFETIFVNIRHPEHDGAYCDYVTENLTGILDILK